MFFISHRGNIGGPQPLRENHPTYILEALKKRYHVEIDVWKNDSRWYLGHDKPQYKIDIKFLKRKGLWCHAKNREALAEMLKHKDIHCFWHQNDDYTLTSRKYIWVYPGQKVVPGCIVVKPENNNFKPPKNVGGICSDYIEHYRHP